jgi:NAD(P) transhydrogenase subunit alpha
MEIISNMSTPMLGLYVFVLACFVGYHVIWGITPALHTPLMAVTNAISAIVIVGAILIGGFSSPSVETVGGTELNIIEIIGFFAVIMASVNIFGGFAVTTRMLSMFKKKK